MTENAPLVEYRPTYLEEHTHMVRNAHYLNAHLVMHFRKKMLGCQKIIIWWEMTVW